MSLVLVATHISYRLQDNHYTKKMFLKFSEQEPGTGTEESLTGWQSGSPDGSWATISLKLQKGEDT